MANIQLENPKYNLWQKAALTLGVLGLFILLLAIANVNFPNKVIWLFISIASILVILNL